MEIEKISNNNLESLTELVLELWPDCDVEEEIDNYNSILEAEAENETCYLVKDEGKYIAFVQVSIRNDYVEGSTDLPIAYLEAIYVKPNYQKQGIARELIGVAEDWARQKGLKQLASDTELSNTGSIDFHKSVGFEEVERIVCFIKTVDGGG